MREKIMEERREHLRVSCMLEVEAKKARNWFLLNSRNIGMDGIMLTCDSDIEKLKKIGIDAEKQVLLSFYLTAQSNVIKVTGKIVHVERKADPIDGSEASFIGIQFNDLSDQTKKQLESFISTEKKKPLV